MEQYHNLPGFFVNMEDDGLQIMPTPKLSARVTIIGTSAFGRTHTPVQINSPEEAEIIFGPYERQGIHNGTTLLPAFKQAYGAGCRNISLVRIPHCEYANVKLLAGEKAVASIDSIVFDKDESDIKVEVSGDKLTVWNAEGKEIQFNLKNGDKYISLGELATRFNSRIKETDSFMRIFEGQDPTIAANLKTEEAGKVEASEGSLFELGSYDDEGSLRGELGKAYKYLLDYESDIIVPAGFHILLEGTDGNVDPEDAVRLADFCGIANSRNTRILGVISVEELDSTSPESVSSLVNKLTAGDFANLYPGQEEDFGKFISVVVGELMFMDPKLGVYSDTGAAAYAGLISSLQPHSSTTNKVIANARGQRYTLYPAQLDELSGSRFVTFRDRIGKGTTVTDGITCARPLSDFQRLTTLRIANSAINITRQMTEPFIGEAMTPTRQEAVNTSIDRGLRKLHEAGAVQRYEFATYYENPQDRINGVLTVAISIVPAFEIRKIRLKLTLKPTL